MHLRRSLRKLAACTAILGLVMTQFAASAIACPLASANVAVSVAADTRSVDTVAGELPCHGAGQSTGAACKAHCENDLKNVPAAHQPPLDFVASFVMAAAPVENGVPASAAQQVAGAHSGPSPPHRLSHCVFRI